MTIKIDLDKSGEDDLEIKGTSQLGRCVVVFVFHVVPWLVGAGLGMLWMSG